MPEVYLLKKTTILDKKDNQYRQIITINKEPSGPLQSRVKRIRWESLSPFDDSLRRNCCGNYPQCIYAFPDPDNLGCYLDVEKFSDLLEFLLSNGYTIDDTSTRLLSQTTNAVSMRNLICFIRY